MDVEFEKKVIVYTVANKGGCNYGTLSRCFDVEPFKDRLPGHVDALILEGRLIRMIFDVPMYGRTMMLFPAGTTIRDVAPGQNPWE